MLVLESMTEKVLGAAFEVHRIMGPGLLESTYRTCLFHELSRRGMAVEQEVVIPVAYKDLPVDTAYRADLIVEGRVLLELKSVERVLPIHEAQVITYLKHGNFPVGLLLNFNVRHLKGGIHRFLRPYPAVPPAPTLAMVPKPWHDPLS